MQTATILEMGNIPVQDCGEETVTEHKRAMVIQFDDISSFQRAIAEGQVQLAYPNDSGDREQKR